MDIEVGDSVTVIPPLAKTAFGGGFDAEVVSTPTNGKPWWIFTTDSALIYTGMDVIVSKKL